jgi:hypothetical protein
MSQFRKKPVVIEATQYLPELDEGGGRFSGVCFCGEGEQRKRAAHVHTAHAGQMVFLEPGDWVTAEPDGRGYYPIKPDIFAATYDPLEPEREAA